MPKENGDVRTISVPSYEAVLLESIVLEVLARFWDSQLSENQPGYRSTKDKAPGFDTKDIA
jgi:hypothetical protein